MALIRSRPAVAGQAAALVAATVRPNAAVVAAAAEWQARIDAIRETAFAEGHQKGVKESQAKVADAERRANDAKIKAEADANAKVASAAAAMEAKYAAALSALHAGIAKLEPLEKHLVAEAETELVRLALAVAAKILHRTVETEPEWMTSLLASALREVPDRRGVAVRMHPEDAAVARERQETIASNIPGLERLTIQDDPSLGRGACMLASQGTRLDAGVATSWERVATALLSEAAVEPPPPSGG